MSRILIGPETVNTLPVETLNAFKDHGRGGMQPCARISMKRRRAGAALKELGIDLNAIAEKLQVDGVAAFATSFDSLMSTLEKKRASLVGIELNRQDLHLGKLQSRVDRRLKSWQAQQFGSRLWKKDRTIWSADPVAELTDRLGWLEMPESMQQQVEALCQFAERSKADGIASRCGPRNGRLEPGTRSLPAQLRQSTRLSGLDGPGQYPSGGD